MVLGAAAAGSALLLDASVHAQQQLSHKTLGTVGLQAGSQANAGLYVVDQVAFYNATDLRDRTGRSLPVGLEADAIGNVLGVAATFRIAPLGTYVGGAVGVPLASARVSTQDPRASLDAFGFGDLYIQPIKLGWRVGPADAVVGYGLYVPTGQYEPGGGDGIGRGNLTQEPSLGGTLFFDAERRWSVSALASYDINGRKRGVDITRGSTLQIQGGAGTTVRRVVDVGVAGYGLWQLTDDSGTALPAVLRGARDRTYGVGPEIDVRIPPIRTAVALRYEHDFLSQARPQGQIVFLGLSFLAWELERRTR